MNFFFQAEDGIRDAQESRGLGDVYKRQFHHHSVPGHGNGYHIPGGIDVQSLIGRPGGLVTLSLIHI